MTVPYRHSVSVAGVIVREDGKVLVIQRRDNYLYQAPGGILEQAETIEDGVAREVLEETGYKVTARALTGVYKNMTRGVVALVFRCDLISGQPMTNDEAAEITWLTLDEVAEKMTEVYATRVTDAFNGPWPHIRHHDGIKLLAPDARP